MTCPPPFVTFGMCGKFASSSATAANLHFHTIPERLPGALFIWRFFLRVFHTIGDEHRGMENDDGNFIYLSFFCWRDFFVVNVALDEVQMIRLSLFSPLLVSRIFLPAESVGLLETFCQLIDLWLREF